MNFFVSTLLILLSMLPLSFAVDDKHACGAVSLYHLATILGVKVSPEEIDNTLKSKSQGYPAASFEDLIACAKNIGLELQGLNLTYEQLQTFNTPVIAHLKTTFEDENPSAVAENAVGHFIVVEHASVKWVRLFDTPQSTLRETATIVSRDRFLALWTGRTLTLSQQQQQQWQPTLFTTPTLHDFGKGKAGEYRLSVQLKNRSNVPVKIMGITSNCNCSVIKQWTNLIPADDLITFDVNWDASAINRSLFTTIYIQTDTPKRPHTFVSLGLIREFSLVFIPNTIYVTGTSASNIKRTVELQNLSETISKIQKVESSKQWIQPVLRGNTVIPPWRATNIELHFETEQMPLGEIINETLTVYYMEGDGETKILTLSISGEVDQRYTLIPNRFFFGRITADGENTKAMVLHNLSDTELHIEKVETDIGTTQVIRLKDKNRYQVQLTLPSLLPTGILKGNVRIYTSHPKMPLIKVPVFALVVK